MDAGYNLLTLTTIFIIFCVRLDAQKFESPCPSLFIYQQRDDSIDRWYGLMNLKSDTDITGITLKFTLDYPAMEFGNLLGRVITSNHKEYIVESRHFQLTRNSSRLLRFYITFDPKKPIPKLISIEQNNELICSDLDKPFSQIFISTFVNSSVTQDVSIPISGDDNNKTQCGIIAAQATPLIIQGRVASIGKYPWHVALYGSRSDEDKTLQYACGGSLISEQWIITAGHCAISPSIGRIVEAHLGKHYLVRKEPNVQIAEISDIVIHPRYGHFKHINDLALLKLKEPVVINDYVRPVCLWKGETDYENILNKIGSIPGWGTDVSGEFSEELKETNLVFSSYQDCLKRNPTYYITRNSYCGKPVDGVQCEGDLGGGMVFRDNSSDREVHYLRGVSSYGRGCNVANFDVFTDVATYLDFIKANIH